jgi:hypothetical protein
MDLRATVPVVREAYVRASADGLASAYSYCTGLGPASLIRGVVSMLS